jgi:hypothetical protein
MSLQDRIDAFKADFEAGKPPYSAPTWIHEPMHRATKELIDYSGAASRALKVGDKAPTFTLKDPEGHAVSSTDLLARGSLIVTFYRGRPERRQTSSTAHAVPRPRHTMATPSSQDFAYCAPAISNASSK